MKIKVCGMRDGENIRQVCALGIDWIGMVFCGQSPRNVTMIPTNAGIIPDRGPESLTSDIYAEGGVTGRSPKRVGVFTDEMAQNVITRVVNFRLDAVQLNGHESPMLIRNLRATLTTTPNGSKAIAPSLQLWKTISIETAADLALCKSYEDCVDMFVFDVKSSGNDRLSDFSVLSAYDGSLPFLLCGNIGPEDAEVVSSFIHPQCIGVDLNELFETAPAVKDVERLRRFLKQVR